MTRQTSSSICLLQVPDRTCHPPSLPHQPADAARLRGDSDSEEEADGGAAGGSTPRASLFGVASPRSGARRQGSKTPRGSGRRGLRLQLDVSPGSGQKSVGRRLFAVSNPSRCPTAPLPALMPRGGLASSTNAADTMLRRRVSAGRPKSGRGPVKPGMRPRIGASRLGKMAAAGPEDLSHLQDNADGAQSTWGPARAGVHVAATHQLPACVADGCAGCRRLPSPPHRLPRVAAVPPLPGERPLHCCGVQPAGAACGAGRASRRRALPFHRGGGGVRNGNAPV